MASFLSFLVTFLLVGTSSGAGNCPKGSTDYGDRSECIYPVNARTNYTVAKEVCQNVGGQIIKIRDILENAVTGTVAGSQIASNAQSYIGVIKGANGAWLNDDGTQLTYSNWKSGHPLVESNCAVISSANNQWTSVGCDSLHTFICTMPDNPSGCPRDWVSYNGSCYYFYNPQLIPPILNFNQSSAQSSCQSMQSNLASIHSDAEFNFLKNQISTATPTTVRCSSDQAVIGFTCVSNVYRWLDGSLVDYNQARGACNLAYGIINDIRCSQNGYWDYWGATSTFSRYICKKTATRMMIDLESVLKKFMIL